MGRARFPAGEAREALAVDGRAVEFAEVSMGNPHAIIEHPAPDDVVRALGPAIEVDARFPRAHQRRVRPRRGPVGADDARVGARRGGDPRVRHRRVRGGRGRACGWGASTSPVTVHLAGGDLEIAVDDDLEVTMTGPAEEIYRGELVPGTGARAGGALTGRPSAPSGSGGCRPYLFAQIEQKIAAKKARGRRRHLARHRRPRHAHARASSSRRCASRSRARTPTSTRPTGAARASARPLASASTRALRRDARPGDADHPGDGRQGGRGQHQPGLPRPGRRRAGERPGLPGLHHRSAPGGRRAGADAAPGRSSASSPTSTAIPGRRPVARQADVPQLPEQPDRRSHRGRLLRPGGRLRHGARHHRRPRQRLLRDHLRRLPRAVVPRDPGRDGRRHRDLLAVEDLQHDRLAGRRRGRQRRPRRPPTGS